MNYYILPKNNNKCNFFTENQNKESDNQIISQTLNKYLTNIKFNMMTYSPIDIIEVSRFIHNYSFICSNMLDKTSISKVSCDNNIFYELIEIINVFSLFDYFQYSKNALYIGENTTSIQLFVDTIEERLSSVCDFKNITLADVDELDMNKRFDFIMYECTESNILEMLKCICNFQSYNGVSIIKIDSIYSGLTVEVLYILSNLFDKVCLMKPVVSNILMDEKYIVCKGMDETYRQYYLDHLINEKERQIKERLLDESVPYYFLTKIEEFNAIYGQQQLESFDQLINLLNHKNKLERFETLKRSNIQKCIQWCERNQIQYNKMYEKTNIFLHAKTESETNIFL